MSSHPRSIAAAASLLLVGAIMIAGCQQENPAGPTVTEVEFAKPGGGGGGKGPKVDSAVPSSAPQATTLDVTVSGSGFEEGSDVTFTIDGVPQDEVKTNGTTFNSKRELVANVTIGAEATIELYDVEVRTPPGKKGTGADLFSVTSSSGRPSDRDLLTAVIDGAFSTSSAPLDGTSPRILHDGSASYADGQDGMEVYVMTDRKAGRMLLDLRGSTRTFWLDLRPDRDASSAVIDWMMIADACGTDELGTETAPCESTQYLSTRMPDFAAGENSAPLAVFWKDAVYQYRLTLGGGCENGEDIPANYVSVTEVLTAGVVTGWVFEATNQPGWLVRRRMKGGGGTKGRDCLGTVEAPFKITFTKNTP